MTSTEGPEPLGRVSVFFPMWNEEEYIERAVAAAAGTCRELVDAGHVRDYEIIVVDDASTDRTPQIADALAAADPHVRVVHHPTNRKLGGSMRSGFEAATGDVVLYTDADLPFEMRELVRALRVLQTYEVDIVSAYRLDRTGEGPRRAVYSFLYNGLIRAMFGMRVRDVNFAFKLVRREVLDHVTLRSEGSFIDAELLVRAQKAGFQVLQIGVDYFPRTRGVSTLSSLGVIRTMLAEMWTLRRELRTLPARPGGAAS